MKAGEEVTFAVQMGSPSKNVSHIQYNTEVSPNSMKQKTL